MKSLNFVLIIGIMVVLAISGCTQQIINNIDNTGADNVGVDNTGDGVIGPGGVIGNDDAGDDDCGYDDCSPDNCGPEGCAYSLSVIAEHSSEDDCWMIIDGKVYDFTDYVSIHPTDSETLLQGCGIDATGLFETRPMGSGTPHSDDARVLLVDYQIGYVKQV
ncbi:cytochrome b5 domain-containing protein [Candidatus Aenigmatarchaeota archaeon]